MASAKKTKKGAPTTMSDFGKRNYLILGIGAVLILAGFILLALGDITVSPILLVLGYCIVVPLGILLPEDKENGSRLDVNKNNAVSG